MDKAACLCSCRCGKIYQVLKVYDHLKGAESSIKGLENQIKNMDKIAEIPWHHTLYYSNGRYDAHRAFYHLKEIHDRYAKALGMEDE